jgi:hypothetical protein
MAYSSVAQQGNTPSRSKVASVQSEKLFAREPDSFPGKILIARAPPEPARSPITLLLVRFKDWVNRLFATSEPPPARLESTEALIKRHCNGLKQHLNVGIQTLKAISSDERLFVDGDRIKEQLISAQVIAQAEDFIGEHGSSLNEDMQSLVESLGDYYQAEGRFRLQQTRLLRVNEFIEESSSNICSQVLSQSEGALSEFNSVNFSLAWACQLRQLNFEIEWARDLLSESDEKKRLSVLEVKSLFEFLGSRIESLLGFYDKLGGDKNKCAEIKVVISAYDFVKETLDYLAKIKNLKNEERIKSLIEIENASVLAAQYIKGLGNKNSFTYRLANTRLKQMALEQHFKAQQSYERALSCVTDPETRADLSEKAFTNLRKCHYLLFDEKFEDEVESEPGFTEELPKPEFPKPELRLKDELDRLGIEERPDIDKPIPWPDGEEDKFFRIRGDGEGFFSLAELKVRSREIELERKKKVEQEIKKSERMSDKNWEMLKDYVGLPNVYMGLPGTRRCRFGDDYNYSHTKIKNAIENHQRDLRDKAFKQIKEECAAGQDFPVRKQEKPFLIEGWAEKCEIDEDDEVVKNSFLEMKLSEEKVDDIASPIDRDNISSGGRSERSSVDISESGLSEHSLANVSSISLEEIKNICPPEKRSLAVDLKLEEVSEYSERLRNAYDFLMNEAIRLLDLVGEGLSSEQQCIDKKQQRLVFLALQASEAAFKCICYESSLSRKTIESDVAPFHLEGVYDSGTVSDREVHPFEAQVGEIYRVLAIAKTVLNKWVDQNVSVGDEFISGEAKLNQRLVNFHPDDENDSKKLLECIEKFKLELKSDNLQNRFQLVKS